MRLSSYPTQELITLQLALSVALQNVHPDKMPTLEKWGERINEAIEDSVFEASQLPFTTPNDVIVLIEKI